MARISWTNFLAGMANSKRTGEEGSYYRGDGVRIDKPMGYVGNGGELSDDGASIKSAGDSQRVVIRQNWVFTADSSSNYEISSLANNSSQITFTNTASDKVGDMAVVQDSSGVEHLFYSYGKEIGKAKVDNLGLGKLTNNNNTWLSDSQSITLDNSNPPLFSKHQRLYVADGRSIDFWDGLDDSYNEDKLDLPASALSFSESGQYLAMMESRAGNVGYDNIYFWDGSAASWNFSVPVKGNIRDIKNIGGQVYFTYGPPSYTTAVGVVNKDLSSYKTLKTFSSDAYTIDDSGVSGKQLGVSGKSLYIPTVERLSNTTTVRIFKLGGPAEIGNALTVDMFNRKSAGTSSGVAVYANETRQADGHIYYVDGDGNEHFQEYSLNDTSSTNSVFETTEQDISSFENNFSKGRLEELAIFYDESSSNTTVKAVLDDTEYTLADSVSFASGSSVKVLPAQKQEFQSMRVKIQGELPEIKKIQANYKADTLNG